MVVTEGLLICLTAEQVSALARNLHAEPQVRFWLIDLASPRLVKMLRRTWRPKLEAANAPLQFAPAEETAFFAPLGGREAEFHPTWEESLSLRRSIPLAPLWNFAIRLRSRKKQEEVRRFSGIVLLERT